LSSFPNTAEVEPSVRDAVAVDTPGFRAFQIGRIVAPVKIKHNGITVFHDDRFLIPLDFGFLNN
jgi:hypothetical protein